MDRVPEPVRTCAWFAIGVACLSGYVDGFGFLTVGTFLSFMSGNTTKLGVASEAVAASSATAIASFFTGVVAASVVQQSATAKGRRIVLSGSGALLAVAAAARFVVLPELAMIALASLAMGGLNTMLSRVANEPVSLTFVTGTLSRLGRHIASALTRAPLEDAAGPWDTHLWRAALLARLWGGFLGGAVLARLATPRLGALALVPPALVLLVGGLWPGRRR